MRRHAFLVTMAVAATCALCIPQMAWALDNTDRDVLVTAVECADGLAVADASGVADSADDSDSDERGGLPGGLPEDAEVMHDAAGKDSPADAVDDDIEASLGNKLPDEQPVPVDSAVIPVEAPSDGDAASGIENEPVSPAEIAVAEAEVGGDSPYVQGAASLQGASVADAAVAIAPTTSTKAATTLASPKKTGGQSAKTTSNATVKKATKKSAKKAAKKVAKKASKHTLSAGWYTVKSRLNKAFAVYLKGMKRKAGTPLMLAKGAASPGFAFKLEKSGKYYRVLVGISTGKSVRLSSKVAVTGAKGGGADLFKLKYVKKLKAYRLVNKATGLALTVAGGKAAKGAALVGKKAKSKSKAQAFVFQKRGGILGKGVYAIKPATDTWSALTVDGSRAFWYGYMKDFDQKWQVAPVSGKDNVYTIESISTGKRLAGVKDAQSVLKAASASDKAQQWKARYTVGGIVWKNVHTKAPLSTEAGDTDDGCWAMNRDYADASTRQLKMVEVPAVESGVYTLRLGADLGLGLAVADGSKRAGAGVQAAARKDANAQKWYYNAGKRTLTNVNSGLVLEAKAKKSGAKLVQRKARGAKTQTWDFEYVGGGKFQVLSGAKSGLVVGVGSAKAGKAAKNLKDKDKAIQQWKVTPALVSVSPKGFNLIKDVVNAGHGKLMPDYVVIHETANPGASALAHRNLWAGSSYYADYAVHYTLDWTGDCYQCVAEDRRCWQVGNGNGHVLGIELCHATNAADFKKVWNAGVQWAAWELKRHHWGIRRLISHDECRTIWGGTDHTDPVGYFAQYGKTWADFKADVAKAMK